MAKVVWSPRAISDLTNIRAERGLREWTLIYPYVLRYRVRNGVTEIVRIKHGAERSD